MSLSHEARPSVTNQSNTELPTETLPGTPGNEPEKKSRRNMFIGLGSGAAALALAGGLFAGLGHGDSTEKTEPKSEPVATAPANPGPSESTAPTEAPSAPATEAAPTPEKVGTDYIKNEFTTETFPYLLDGQQVSREQLISTVAISTEKYPTFQDAMPVVIDQLNGWINSGANKTESDAYGEGAGKNGIYLSMDEQRTGTTGIAQDFYNPAYNEALTTGNDQAFNEYINNLHYQTLGYFYRTKNDAVPYESHFTFEGYTRSLGVGDAATVYATINFSDNGDKNSMADLRAEAGGFQGITTPTIDDTNEWHFELVQRDGNWMIDSVDTNANSQG